MCYLGSYLRNDATTCDSKKTPFKVLSVCPAAEFFTKLINDIDEQVKMQEFKVKNAISILPFV